MKIVRHIIRTSSIKSCEFSVHGLRDVQILWFLCEQYYVYEICKYAFTIKHLVN